MWVLRSLLVWTVCCCPVVLHGQPWVVTPGGTDTLLWNSRALGTDGGTSWLAVQRQGNVAVVRIGMLAATGATQYPTCDAACARQRLFGTTLSVASYYDEMCGFHLDAGTSTVTTTATTLTASNMTAGASCNMEPVTAAAQVALAAAGMSRPTVMLVLLPPLASTGPCAAFGGLGVLGCEVPNCITWLFDGADVNTWIHELGHNFGLNHASVDANNDGVTDINSVTGAVAEYADASDPMGTPLAPVGPRVQAVHLMRLGALSATHGAIARLVNNRSIVLDVWPASAAPRVASAATAQRVRLAVIQPPAAGTSAWWLSARTATAGTYDAALPSRLAPAVYLHRHGAFGDVTRLVARLTAAGDGFDGSEDGFRIQVLALPLAPDAPARITVATCMQPKSPTVRVAPLPSWAFTVTNDNVLCGLASAYLGRVVATVPPWQAPLCTNVTVALTSDRFPRELSFAVRDARTGALLLSGSPGVASVRYCGPFGAELVMTLTDTEGDGFCCAFGRGVYALYMDGVLVANSSKFTSRTLAVSLFNAPYVRTADLAPHATDLKQLGSVPAHVLAAGANGTVTLQVNDVRVAAAVPAVLVTLRASTASASVSSSRTRTPSPSVSTTPSRTRIRSSTVSASASATPSRTRSSTVSASATPSRTRSRSASPSPTASRQLCPQQLVDPSTMQTVTVTVTATVTATVTVTVTVLRD